MSSGRCLMQTETAAAVVAEGVEARAEARAAAAAAAEAAERAAAAVPSEGEGGGKGGGGGGGDFLIAYTNVGAWWNSFLFIFLIRKITRAHDMPRRPISIQSHTRVFPHLGVTNGRHCPRAVSLRWRMTSLHVQRSTILVCSCQTPAPNPPDPPTPLFPPLSLICTLHLHVRVGMHAPSIRLGTWGSTTPRALPCPALPCPALPTSISAPA